MNSKTRKSMTIALAACSAFVGLSRPAQTPNVVQQPQILRAEGVPAGKKVISDQTANLPLRDAVQKVVTNKIRYYPPAPQAVAPIATMQTTISTDVKTDKK